MPTADEPRNNFDDIDIHEILVENFEKSICVEDIGFKDREKGMFDELVLKTNPRPFPLFPQRLKRK